MTFMTKTGYIKHDGERTEPWIIPDHKLNVKSSCNAEEILFAGFPCSYLAIKLNKVVAVFISCLHALQFILLWSITMLLITVISDIVLILILHTCK